MEESQETWKGYLIIRDGKYWRVFKEHHYYGGLFTMLTKARAFIDAKINDDEIKEHNLAIKRIRKEPDIRKRARMYKKLCQTQKCS